MYLTPNFTCFTVPSYIHTQSSSAVVRAASAYDLRQAAETELLKYSPRIHEDTLYFEADEALGALDSWIDSARPKTGTSDSDVTLVEAALFSYTYLLLEPTRWAHTKLPELVNKYDSLLVLTQSIEDRLPKLRAPDAWVKWAYPEKSGAYTAMEE